MSKQQTQIRLTAEGLRLLKLLVAKSGLNQTAYIEQLIRETAKKEKLK